MHDHFDHIPDWRIRDKEIENQKVHGSTGSVMKNTIRIGKFENLHKRQAESFIEDSTPDFFERLSKKQAAFETKEKERHPAPRNYLDFLNLEQEEKGSIVNQPQKSAPKQMPDDDDWFINGLF